MRKFIIYLALILSIIGAGLFYILKPYNNTYEDKYNYFKDSIYLKGLVIYRIDSTYIINKSKTIELTIIKDSIIKDTNMKYQTRNISDKYDVRLYSNNSNIFFIKLIDQRVDECGEYWKWNVEPIDTGKFKLLIDIKQSNCFVVLSQDVLIKK